MTAALWLALASAVAHGFSFVWSRELVRRAGQPTRAAFFSLLACTVPALAMAPVVGFGGFARAPWLIVGMAASGIASQLMLMGAMRRAHASFVVPAVGIKVFFVAVLAALLFDETYGPTVYAGAAGSVVALFILNRARFATSVAGLAFVLGAAFFYATNDALVLAQLRAGYTPAEVFMYAMLGPALVLLPASALTLRGQWRPQPGLALALTLYALVHVAGIIALMVAFHLGQGITLINVLQNSRGAFAVIFVALLARLGVLGVERLERRDGWLRLAGAGLMTGSLALAVAGP
jgi:drug/metabolite transporter (DMT)-like permease